ncbi:hypothetical protein BDP27DRAFT_1365238 [Rhodocollybia butyracea]|uniref:Uncharacterized protein n=1 Tax=Rhodocollybia butyracea TaxID=206335 RepID=A0A9P5PR32_9AGAR|nr:hypothetical protein BDP27DRAFT_1365238 [Rhodocollybia butyracea]
MRTWALWEKDIRLTIGLTIFFVGCWVPVFYIGHQFINSQTCRSRVRATNESLNFHSLASVGHRAKHVAEEVKCRGYKNGSIIKMDKRRVAKRMYSTNNLRIRGATTTTFDCKKFKSKKVGVCVILGAELTFFWVWVILMVYEAVILTLILIPGLPYCITYYLFLFSEYLQMYPFHFDTYHSIRIRAISGKFSHCSTTSG